MRIYLLSKYIGAEETQQWSLRDCPVVIDGHNYFYNIYKKSKIPYMFGCEADKFAYYLKHQFEMFRRANIKCYIVFKGGDEDIEKKIKKYQHLILNFDLNCEFIQPVLSKDVTVQTLNEMGLANAFCVTEAKDECVALAERLECPIISYDIGYCFRKSPYIPHITMKYDNRTKSIQCRQYKLQNFLQKNSLTEEKAALFAMLTDSSIFPAEFFDSLLQTWGVFNIDQYSKLKNLIAWLSKHSEQEARDGISEILSNDGDRNTFWENYHTILRNMRKDEPGHVTEYLINSNIAIMRQDPEWFEKGVVCKYVSPAYINLYKSKCMEGSWVILDKNFEDSLLLSIDIVKYAYNLLTNYRGDTIKVYQDSNTFVEIDTGDTNVRKPSYECCTSVFENGWDQVTHLKLFEHFLTENHINIEVLAKLRPDHVVLFIALAYFARRKQFEGKDVTREVYAVILSSVLLGEALCKNSKELLYAKDVTAKYFKRDVLEVDRKSLNSLVQLQYCIIHMNYLNKLCGSPYETTQYRKVYNGTFVYIMLSHLREHGDCADFVKELFKKAPTVLAVVEDLFQVYLELLMRK